MEKGTRITINVRDPSDSCYIVFREKAVQPSVAQVKLDESVVTPAALSLFYNEGNQLVGEAAIPGTYTLSMTDGTTRRLEIIKDTKVFEIKDDWKTTKKDMEGYSVYKEILFELPSDFADGQRVVMDLGKVEVMAQVTLNDTVFDTLWAPPFRVDVSDALKAGRNDLTILVPSTSEGAPKIGPNVLLETIPFGIAD